ncbi:MAG: macro domain-containing protein [Alphaproteobacteria bacterium]|nr:macro domain-containing protein [Alphaproteobacteria bacterium]
MITYRKGDILSADVEALVNTVNCVGIMGRGIALQFKNAFPYNFKAYEEACQKGEVQPGRMFVHDMNTLVNPRYIINFPTKRHWRGKSRMEDIQSGLQALVEVIRKRNIRSIAIPPLGSGLGGLSWLDVRPQIEEALRGFNNLEVVVYEPNGAPEAKNMSKSSDVPKMTAGRAALVVLVDRYLKGLLDPFVTLLELHKLMYFMQESGQNLRLKYVKAPYGPYAENLRHVLRHVEGHLISGYADGGDAPDKQIELVPGAIADAELFLRDNDETRYRFDRVANLVEGFESPFGLELLSTVHWISTHDEGEKTLGNIIQQTYAWNERKRQFSPNQIQLACQVLADKGWSSGVLTRSA